jgi:hypothetical protein
MSEVSAQTQLALLVDIVDQVAKAKHDGHFTVMRFTTEWKAVFGTPDLGNSAVRTKLQGTPGYSTLQEALTMLLIHHYKA